MDAPHLTAFNQKKRLATLWLMAGLFLFAFALTRPLADEGTSLHEALEVTGLVLVFAAILGRLWAILFIGARKNAELVTDGPYSMCRNPLYFFSLLGIAGVGLMFGSLLLTALVTAAAIVIFRYTALREASYLRSRFPAAHEAYAARTPLLWPDPRRYTSAETVAFSQAALTKTFLDCLAFLALFPLAEGIEALHLAGYLPTVLFLP